MGKSRPPTRAEFERLRTVCAELSAKVTILLQRSDDLQRHLEVQFKRIAEMQAILDEEHRHDYPPEPNPLTLQSKRLTANGSER